MELKAKILSSLEKCFLDETLDKFTEITEEKIFKNQKYSFQIAFETPNDKVYFVKAETESDIDEYISIREVKNIPSDMAVFAHSDEDVLRRETGLYPDLLRPGNISAKGTLNAFWFTFEPKSKVVGKFSVKVKLLDVLTNELYAEKTITIDVKDVELPEQELVFGQWLHIDCIADYYKVEPRTERFDEICENFVKTAVEGGRNMMMVPLLTPSLDIHHNGYRTDIQLVDIYKNGDEYTFDYTRLDKWLDMLTRNGVKYYEVCHLFTQWGATSAPAVMAHVDGEYKRIFGWDTDALCDEFKTFLRYFVKCFIDHMKERGEDHKCLFHISDEPVTQHIPQFKAVKEIVADLIKDYRHIDALSHYEFYEMGLINTPVPGTPYIKPFIENKVPDLWCYYCGGQCKGVSNCHFAMPLSRTRYIGVQFFKYNVKGFLNWGYNFYNNQWSYEHVDPFLTSTGECFVASGDTYMVYPAPDGTAWASNRYMAFYEAIEDLRAMKLCASLYSYDEVIKVLEEITGEIVFDKCVCDSATMLKIRHTIDDMIFDKLGK